MKLMIESGQSNERLHKSGKQCSTVYECFSIKSQSSRCCISIYLQFSSVVTTSHATIQTFSFNCGISICCCSNEDLSLIHI